MCVNICTHTGGSLAIPPHASILMMMRCITYRKVVYVEDDGKRNTNWSYGCTAHRVAMPMLMCVACYVMDMSVLYAACTCKPQAKKKLNVLAVVVVVIGARWLSAAAVAIETCVYM